MITQKNPLVDALETCVPSEFGGINLLLEVLSSGGKTVEITNKALLQMASKSDCRIKPEQYVTIAKELGLIHGKNQEIELTNLGHQFVSIATWPPFDRLNQSQIELIAPELIVHPSIRPYVMSILSRMNRLSNSNYVYHLGSQKLSREEIIILQLLQTIGFISAEKNYLYVSNKQLLSIISYMGELPLWSEEDLWHSLQETNLRAKAAENYVVKYERNRLQLAGRNDLRNLVRRVSEYNVNAGFDVSSFSVDGSMRYIEVKSAKTFQIQFYWSAAEMQFAEQHPGEYWLYFVPRAQDLPNLEHGLIMFNDPLNLVKEGIINFKPTTFHVFLDTHFKTPDDPRIFNEITKQS